MNKLLWVVLVVCLAMVALMSWTPSQPDQKKAPPPVNFGMQDPLYIALHSKNYASVESIVKTNPGILKKLHAQGGTYINCTAMTKDAKMMKLLIRLGADPNFAATCGSTPIMIAVNQDDIAMASVLLQAGADPNKYSGSQSPLDTAKLHNNDKMLKLLRQYRAK